MGCRHSSGGAYQRMVAVMTHEHGGRRPHPLSGVRVLETASYATGPFAGMMLADLGADVVKVEPPPRGDPFRSFGLRHQGTSAFWWNLNRNKRSILLDLKSPADRARFLKLAGAADVLIENWRPGVAAGLGIDDDVLLALNPRLVRVSITGFGTSGPLAAAPAFDALLQAQSGLAAAQSRDERPELVQTALIDKSTGVFAVQAVLAALLERARSGRGGRIDIAMLDVTAYFNFPDLLQDRTFVDSDQRLRPRRRSDVLSTADGYVVVMPVSGRHLSNVVVAVDRPDWTEELRAIKDPVELVDRLFDLLEQVTVQRTTAELLEAFRARDVPAAEVLSIDAHLVDAQVGENDLYSTIVDPVVGRVRSIRYPARFAALEPVLAGRAPSPGADADTVFPEWLGR